MITFEVVAPIDRSVLCWLATVSHRAGVAGCGAIQRAMHWQRILADKAWPTKLQIAENDGNNRTTVYLHLSSVKLPKEIIDFW